MMTPRDLDNLLAAIADLRDASRGTEVTIRQAFAWAALNDALRDLGIDPAQVEWEV